MYYLTFQFFKEFISRCRTFKKHDVAKTEDLVWLNQFGTIGTFLKNDIKLIKRNKRSKTTVGLSVMFLFYGFLFFTNSIEMYNLSCIFLLGFLSGGFNHFRAICSLVGIVLIIN
jgi:hypothetical protein